MLVYDLVFDIMKSMTSLWQEEYTYNKFLFKLDPTIIDLSISESDLKRNFLYVYINSYMHTLWTPRGGVKKFLEGG